MENTSTEKIQQIVKAQKEFFASGASLDIKFRKEMLSKLYETMENWENRLCDALWTDLHKSYEEAYLTEISIVKAEIRNHIRHVAGWARRKKACSPLKIPPTGIWSRYLFAFFSPSSRVLENRVYSFCNCSRMNSLLSSSSG